MNPSVSSPAEKAVSYFKTQFKSHMDDLKELVKIPSVSFAGFPETEVIRSAEAVAQLLKKRGLQNVEILKLPNAHPYVYGERLNAPDKPTLLLYAHHDVQPPGREELWKTSPFEPTEKQGPEGLRLYARGSADDKAGIVVHTSAIASYLDTIGELPINVKVVIEGEEEIGSPNLYKFLSTYRKKLDADVLVLTDAGNFDCGIPALTIALRGLVGVDVEVRALTKTVHSGMWGGPLPDSAMALSKMLAALTDENGRIAIPGIMDQVKPISAREIEDFKKIPYNEGDFRKQSGIVDSAHLHRHENPAVTPSIQTWRLPSLTVNAIQASSRKQAGNVPDMDPEQVSQALQAFLRKNAPWGVEVHTKVEACNGPWSTDPTGPAFQAAHIALKKGYGQDALNIGCGGSIPFVQPFADALGGAPALLLGVEDPYTNAHGENESLHIGDFEKACVSQIHLFSEIAEHWRKK